MSDQEQLFQDEEQLRQFLEDRGAIHDCVEANCTVNPDGEPIDGIGKPQVRPKLTEAENALYKKLKGEDHPDYVSAVPP